MTSVGASTVTEDPSSASPLRRTFSRRQVTVFVILTMAISWSVIPVADGGLLPHGPMLAALLVLAGSSGRRGVSALWAQVTRWRVSWKWYVVAPGIFLCMHAAALAVAAAAGLARLGSGSTVLSVGAVVGVWLPLVLLGGQWEEPGWLGYLARRLQVMVSSPLQVLLAAGLIRVVWHTPLVLLGTIPWYDYVFGSFALQVILLWLYNRTGGSVLVPMICHLFSNLTMATALPLLAEADRWRYWLVFVVIEAAVAVAILLATKGALGADRRSRTAVDAHHKGLHDKTPHHSVGEPSRHDDQFGDR